MPQKPRGGRVHEQWAHLRFSVIGQLLAAPPSTGELRAGIEALAARTWQHPTTSEPVRFGFSTIERWYYRALRERTDPVGVRPCAAWLHHDAASCAPMPDSRSRSATRYGRPYSRSMRPTKAGASSSTTTTLQHLPRHGQS